MNTLKDPTDEFKTRFRIEDVRANVDTIELWCRCLPAGIRKLDELSGKRMRVRPVKDGWGYILCLNQPNRKVLAYVGTKMAQLSKNEPKPYWLHIHRVDIGVEFLTAEPEYASELQWLVDRHLTLKWNRSLGVRDEYGTSYWTKPNAPRNIVAYSDKPSRMTSTDHPCCRLELRMQREALGRYGYTDINSIVEINPKDLFNRHMRWTGYDQQAEEKRIARVIRRNCQRERQRRGTKTLSPFTDTFVSNLPRRYRGFIDRFGIICSNRHRSKPTGTGDRGLLELIPGRTGVKGDVGH